MLKMRDLLYVLIIYNFIKFIIISKFIPFCHSKVMLVIVLVRVLQRNRTNKIYVCVYMYIYRYIYRETDRQTDRQRLILRNYLNSCRGWQVENLQVRPVGWRPRKGLMFQLKSKHSLEVVFCPPGETSVFFSYDF